MYVWRRANVINYKTVSAKVVRGMASQQTVSLASFSAKKWGQRFIIIFIFISPYR